MMSEVWRPSNVISFVNHDNITVWWHVIGSQIVQRELHHRVSTTFMRTVKVPFMVILLMWPIMFSLRLRAGTNDWH